MCVPNFVTARLFSRSSGWVYRSVVAREEWPNAALAVASEECPAINVLAVCRKLWNVQPSIPVARFKEFMTRWTTLGLRQPTANTKGTPQNKPTASEFSRCQPYLERTIALLPNLRVVVGLGVVAMHSFLRAWHALGHEVPSPKPRFRHAGRWSLPPITLIASYHPSQRNTQTGLLTEVMFDRVFYVARGALSMAVGVSGPPDLC